MHNIITVKDNGTTRTVVTITGGYTSAIDIARNIAYSLGFEGADAQGVLKSADNYTFVFRFTRFGY